MEWNVLLKRQLQRYLPDEEQQVLLEPFLKIVNASYFTFERDKKLSEHAFKVSNEEYENLNEVLRKELELKQFSVDKLKEAVSKIQPDITWDDGDTLLHVVDILKEEFAKRKAAEELWEFALESAGEGVWDYDVTTNTVFFSPKYKRILGFEVDELRDDPIEWLSRIHPDDLALIEADEEDYSTGRITSHEREYRIRHKNGHYIWISDRGKIVNYTDTDTPARIVGTHIDITARKLAEQALKTNEEKYRNIIANMNLGLLEVDKEQVIQYANQSFCAISGYQLNELIGNKASELFADGDNLDVVNHKTQLRDIGVSDAYEIAVKTKSGESRWWLISGAPRYNDNGELIGSIGIHLDITSQKKLEFELKEARIAAEESARAKEAFLANMSHEIRTPMNAIIGMSRQLSRTQLEDDQKLYLRTITSASDHLLVVINDILDISKIEAGKLELYYGGFDPREIFKQVLNVIQIKADERGIGLHLNTDNALATVLMGDEHRLSQILLNLASNAVKFTEKGDVTIDAKVIVSKTDEQVLRISVKDTGIGLEDEFIKTLFDKFTQEERSTSKKFGGTGLGMAICKQLVELMHGTIEVKSKKHFGTEATIIIPFNIGTLSDLPDKLKQIADTSFLKNKRVLLAEDNEMNRLVASSLLRGYGILLTEAVNGKEAVDALRVNAYDVVLMDMQMPVMNGLEASAYIRNKLQLDIPIIALTANVLKGEKDRCFAAGMNGFVAKPFDENQLINAMAYVLNENMAWSEQKELEQPEPKLLADNHLFALDKINDLGRGNKEFVNKLLTLFITQMPALVKDIKDAYIKDDYQTIKAIAHKMIPAIHNMEIKSLKQTIENLNNLEEHQLHLAQIDIALLEHVINVCCQQIKPLIDGEV